MRRRQVSVVGLACVLLACGGGDKEPSDQDGRFVSEEADVDGDGIGDGFTVDSDGDGIADGLDRDGDGVSDESLSPGWLPVDDNDFDDDDDFEDDDTIVRPAQCSAPIGTYVYSIKPRVVRGDCTANPVGDTVAFFDSTQSHSFTSEGVGCTIAATTTANNGCTHTDVLSCADGSSITTVCELNADASQLNCIATNDFVAVTCDLEFEAKRSSAADECTPLGGLYQGEIESLTGSAADGCAPSQTVELTDDEVTALLEGSTSCTWSDEATIAADSCSLTRGATCFEGEQASMSCEWNTDSTQASCEITAGPCQYALTLVR